MNPILVRQQIANLRMSHPELVEDEEAWLLSLESETSLDELLRAIERKRQEAECLSVGIGVNIVALKERCARIDRRQDACRDLLFNLMQAADVKNRELPEATLSITNGRPKVLITDEVAVIFHGYGRVICEPDKKLIKDTLDAGQEVPGAVLSNSEPHITIRTR